VPTGFETDLERFDETIGSTVFGADPGIRVRYCLSADSTLCSEWSMVTAADPNRAWQVEYAVPSLNNTGCVAGGTLGVAVNATSAGLPQARVTSAFYNVPDDNGAQWNEYPGDVVPGGATQVKDAAWTITWQAPETSGLDEVAGTTTPAPVDCTSSLPTPSP
jgi:hypothetical protein